MDVTKELLTQPLQVVGKAQGYAWGKVGASSRISSIVRHFDPSQPLAEYWLGAHPKAPADLLVPQAGPLALNQVFHGEHRLPFMVKVLSINPDFGLSIQSHPDSQWAATLHSRDPLNYPDPFHKPEIGVALTPVTLLYGFRPHREMSRVFELFPELVSVVGADLCGAIASKSSAHDRGFVRDIFSEILRGERDAVSRVVESLESRFAGQHQVPDEIALVRRLRPRYGASDVGLLALFVMNIVTVPPGFGVFIGPNIPHAYLDGDLVECMACSDNVIRAGLTPKFTDVEALLQTLSFDVATRPALLSAKGGTDGFAFFDIPVDDFYLGMIDEGSGSIRCKATSSPSLLFVLGDSAIVRHPGSNSLIELSDGGAVLIPAEVGEYEIERSKAALFLAGHGQRPR
jgi:mannose-6-phosphate isomerase